MSIRRSPIYINSADRISGVPGDFRIRLVDIVQAFSKSKVSVISAQIPFSYFGVTTLNNTIIFEETAATPLTATIVPGNYTLTEFLAEVLVRLNAAGASVYTGSQSGITGRLTLVSDGAGGGGIFNLLAGSSALFTAQIPTGFSADQTGALTYTSTNVTDLTAPHAIHIHMSNFNKGYDTRTQQEAHTIAIIPVNVERFGVSEHNPSFAFEFDADRFMEDVDISLRTPEGVILDMHNLNWQFQLHIEERR